MVITMMQTRRGCPDGFIVRQYHAGETYTVDELLAGRFIREHAAFMTGQELPAPHPDKVEDAMKAALERLETKRPYWTVSRN